MESVYDWVTLVTFAGIIVLFLQRSTSEDEDDVSLVYYLLAGAGCAIVNYTGNHGQPAFAILLLAATAAFIIFFLKPLRSFNRK